MLPENREAGAAIRCSGESWEPEGRFHTQYRDKQVYHTPLALAVPAIKSEGRVLNLNALTAGFFEAVASLPCQKLQLVLSAKPSSIPEVTVLDQCNVHPIPQEQRQQGN